MKNTKITEEQRMTILSLADHNMNVAATARAMQYHRNTMVYHIKKIKDATGLDPMKFSDLACLVNEVTIEEPDSYDRIVRECKARMETYNAADAVFNAHHERECQDAILYLKARVSTLEAAMANESASRAKWEWLYKMQLERAKKAERERDSLAKEIQEHRKKYFTYP